MNRDAIQEDYGGFDPRFLGITVRFHGFHHGTWELFRKIVIDPSDPDWVVDLGNKALEDSEDRAFELFSVGTILEHEVRHFHDFILSPFGNHIFRIRLNAMMNGLQALASMADHKAIPVPIPLWRRLDPRQKAELLSSWQSELPIGYSIDTLDRTGVDEALIEQLERQYNVIKGLVVDPRFKGKFGSQHVFEASAIVVQMQAVLAMFGEEHSNLFIQYMLDHAGAYNYTIVLRMLQALWSRVNEPIDSRVISAILAWSLFGDHFGEGYEASPSNRFVKLWDLLRKNGLPQPSRSTASLFGEWSERLGTKAPDIVAKETVALNERSILRIEEGIGKILARNPELAGFTNSVYVAMRSLCSANRLMSEQFFLDPDDYTNPRWYLDNAQSWAAAPVVLDFAESGLVNDNSFAPLVAERIVELVDGRQVVVRARLPDGTRGVELIDAAAARQVADAMTLVDLCFAEFRRFDPDFDLPRELAERNGTLFFEILL